MKLNVQKENLFAPLVEKIQIQECQRIHFAIMNLDILYEKEINKFIL